MRYEILLEDLNQSGGSARLEVRETSSGERKGKMYIDKQGIATQLTSGKGVIGSKYIVSVVVAFCNTDAFGFSVNTKANEKWNSRMKSKHPIRWMLHLIAKSKGGTVELGLLRSQRDASQLIALFKRLGWVVIEDPVTKGASVDRS